MKEKVLIIGDKLQGSTGFAINGMNISWALAEKYDVHYLGLQNYQKQSVDIEIEGIKRKIIQHPNLPRDEKVEWDFGTNSLPVLLDNLEPDILITINDIQMIAHVPNIICPSNINLKLVDTPSKDFLSEYSIQKNLEGEIQRFKEKYPRDIKWIAYCFTPDTKVMTPNGIKYINDIKIGELVYSWNPDTKIIEFARVIDTQKHKINEDIVNIKHQKVDFNVTKEHLFNLNDKEVSAGELLELSDSSNRKFPEYIGLDSNIKEWFEFYKYFSPEYIVRVPKNDQIINKEIFKTNHSNGECFLESKWCDVINYKEEIIDINGVYAKSKSRNGTKIPMKVKYSDFLSLAGWYISEGYLEKHAQKICCNGIKYISYRVCISQQDENNRKKIKNLLDRMKIRYHERKSTISFSGEFYYNLFNTLFHKGTELNSAKSKYIPKQFLNESSIEYLFESLMDGDGHWDKRKNSIGSYYTSSEQLKDDFVTLCFLLGYHPGVHNDGDKYTITISNSETQPIINKNHISKEHYSGYVYDITLDRNNYFFAGRNDKYAITHNCPHDGDPPMMNWKNIYRMADQVVAMSKYGQEIFNKFFNMDVPFIWHGADSTVFKPCGKPQHLKDKFIVGDINRNQPRKQPIRVIEAFAKFAKDKDDVLIHLQKDWNDRFGWPLNYFVNLYGVANKCIKPAEVGLEREKVAQAYSAWDINMMTTAGEGFGLAFAESMMCGTANIACDYTTTRELILEGSPKPRGIIAKHDLYWEPLTSAAARRALVDINDLSNKFEYYYKNRDVLETHSKNAYKWSHKNLNMKKIGKEWLDLVDNTLSGNVVNV
jgi:glycosyltransferase involved in cell wall biosynthesis